MTESHTPETSDSPLTLEDEEVKIIAVPEKVDVNEFQRKSLADLHDIAQEIGLRVAGVRSKHHLIFEILRFYGIRGTRMEAEGFLDYSGDSFGFLRWPDFSFAANADDVYIASNFVKKHELRPGQRVRGVVRAPREREKFLSVDEVLEIEGRPDWQWRDFSEGAREVSQVFWRGAEC